MQTIEHKGFKSTIMRAKRLTGNHVHGLPPGIPIDVYPVDAFEKPLDNWIPGPGNYVVPVESDWGLWFDWRDNDTMNTSILPSIKGMNPITGQRTKGFALERYEEKCPIHKIKFKDGLFCEKCDFKWPHQNYVTYPNILWWDGFRSADGKVRQFFFTEDLLKSVPEQVIGKEDTVPAFGFAFFRTKVRREAEKSDMMRGMSKPVGHLNFHNTLLGDTKGGTKSGGINAYYTSTNFTGDMSDMKLSNTSDGTGLNIGEGLVTANASGPVPCAGGAFVEDSAVKGFENKQVMMHNTLKKKMTRSKSPTRGIEISSNSNVGLGTPNPTKKLEIYGSDIETRERGISLPPQKPMPVKEVGVGGGAEIRQKLNVDTLKLTDWENEPASVMRLYFVFTNQFKDVADKGMKDLVGVENGYMNGIKIG